VYDLVTEETCSKVACNVALDLNAKHALYVCFFPTCRSTPDDSLVEFQQTERDDE
jgi:hypothetical protein